VAPEKKENDMSKKTKDGDSRSHTKKPNVKMDDLQVAKSVKGGGRSGGHRRAQTYVPPGKKGW
jgi:hypothetical protein